MNSPDSPAYRQTQRRETIVLQSLLARPRHRSLNNGLCRLSLGRFGFAPLRLCVSLVLLAFVSSTLHAQEVEDTIKINTRVVFLDALVKDRKTNLPISNLTRDNFEVYDEGQLRQLSYFTREGQARKPLALILILDLRDDGAGRCLKRAEILKAMADELAKLPPEDEVAILAINANSMNATGSVIRDGKAIWLSDFTKDRAQLATAFSKVPSLIEDSERTEAEIAVYEKKEKTEQQQEKKSSLTVSADTEKKVADAPAQEGAPNPENVLETETIKGKNGAVITRTVMKDGSINVKRTSASGHVVVALDDIYDLPAAVRDASQYAQKQRPSSQASIVWVSDGIVPVFFED